MVSNEVDDFVKELEWSILISDIPDTEKLEERLARLQYELDMFDLDKTIDRILKSR